MSTTKVRDRYQVTIPKEIRKQIDCEIGDILEITYRNGNILLIPQKTIKKLSVPRLSLENQRLLKTVQQKMDKINHDHERSVGLTEAEIGLAVKVGLIEEDEAWWWKESWQKGEREATRDIRLGNTIQGLDNLDRCSSNP